MYVILTAHVENEGCSLIPPLWQRVIEIGLRKHSKKMYEMWFYMVEELNWNKIFFLPFL